ncbi:HNH endonuclease [Paraburkholderia sp. SIMBA_030]|uniref:HNH endonuclease n=1 Tax=Paraburkholderia sp. SIMBA_030 TaxID=3085773 RepID=UPI00397CC359
MRASEPFLPAEGTRCCGVHHRRRLTDGGEDAVETAIALCPNCHRQRHPFPNRTSLN